MNTKVSEHENKIPDTSGLATTTVLFTKIAEVEDKIPDVRRFRLEIVEHQAFDSSYFHGKIFFGDDGYQYLSINQHLICYRQKIGYWLETKRFILI